MSATLLLSLLSLRIAPSSGFTVPTSLSLGKSSPLGLGHHSRLKLDSGRNRPAPPLSRVSCSLTSDGRGGQRVRGIVKLQESSTGVPVYIVGAMHYNPVSIQRASTTVEELASANELSSVVIESCESRWSSTMSQPEWMRRLLESEMGAAARLAKERGVEVVLGDQRIEDTSNDIKQVVKETFDDLASPLSGGWSRAISDVARAGAASISAKDKTGLGAADIFDPMLIAAAPVTFIRYPAAWILRSPAVAFGFVGFSFALGLIPEAASAVVAGVSGEVSGGSDDVGLWAGCIVSIALSCVELVLITRLFLVALLDKRNEFLADSIRGACVKSKNSDGGAVVAVLGMAHVNGVQRMLAGQESLDRAP